MLKQEDQSMTKEIKAQFLIYNINNNHQVRLLQRGMTSVIEILGGELTQRIMAKAAVS